MAATLVGTVGVHGIAADETGMVINGLDDTSKMQSNFLKNKVGERVGVADYDESIEITIKGALTSLTPWSQKLSAVLTIANTISAAHLNAATAGKTLVREVQRTRANEDWQGISVTAEMLPYFPTT